MPMSGSEKTARKRIAELGGTIRRDNANRLLIVKVGDKVQRFWQGSWPEIVVWLRKQQPKKRRKGV
jgi:hypothetical protein